MIHECIIGIGSNIDPEQNIAATLFFLRQEQNLISVSSLIKTSPIGIPDMDITAFQGYLKSIENYLKRDRSMPKYGPRTIDLDIIIWDGKIVDPDYYNRDFLKEVVDEIA
jgi:2-amino-4-hydroxy-6-hydroxymethyldihydropteridine diphosphokinase